MYTVTIHSTQTSGKACTAVAFIPPTTDIALSPAFPPVQPKHIRFPTTTYSPTLTETGLSIPLGTIHMIGWNIRLN